MSTDQFDTQLMLADSLASQSRMNDGVTRVLHALAVSVEKADDRYDGQAEDIGALAHELALVNQRIESLTATVGELIRQAWPHPEPGHSVKVPAEDGD